MKQDIKKYFLIFLSFIFIVPCMQPPLHAGFNNMNNVPEMDMNTMQEMLNAEIAKMSDADRENFYQIMDNVERLSQEDPASLERFISGQMSKEEEASFVGSMVPESMMKNNASETQAVDMVPTTTQVPVKEEVKEFTSVQLSLQETITSIITKTESFLVKMQSYPEISTKLRTWAKENSLLADKQWKTIEHDINTVVQKLMIIEREKNNGKKKTIIDILLKDTALIGSLNELNRILTAHEKGVDIVPFGITKITNESKEAMQTIINVFVTEMYRNNIHSLLTESLKGYAPENDKSKEEEKSLTTKAQKENEKTRSKEYMKSAGQEKKSGSSLQASASSYYGDDYADYGSGGSYDYDSYAGSSNYESPYASSSYSPTPSLSNRSSLGGSRSLESGDYANSFDDTQDNDSIKGQPSSKSSASLPTTLLAKKNQPITPVKKDDKKTSKDKAVDSFSKYLKKALKTVTVKIKDKEDKKIVLNEFLSDLSQSLKKPLTTPQLEELQKSFVQMLSYVSHDSKSVLASLKNLTSLLKKESATVKVDYKNKIKKEYAVYKDVIQTLLDQIQTVENNWNDLKITDKKTIYYMWDNTIDYTPVDEKQLKTDKNKVNTVKDEKKSIEKEVKKETIKPTTLNNLKDALKEVQEHINNLMKL